MLEEVRSYLLENSHRGASADVRKKRGDVIADGCRRCLRGSQTVLFLTINSGFIELSGRTERKFEYKIEKITSENLNLQEEIYYLHNDSSTIEREAKKFGFQRKEKKVPVSGNR